MSHSSWSYNHVTDQRNAVDHLFTEYRHCWLTAPPWLLPRLVMDMETTGVGGVDARWASGHELIACSVCL